MPGTYVDRCKQFEDYHLVYVGIAPKKERGKSNLQERIWTHFGKTRSNNASWSTLRLSIGCLLYEHLDIQLQCVKNRKHFDEGESVLSDWIDNNAIVVWHVFNRPWEIEKEVIERLSLPLNLTHNKRHPFYSYLYKLRKKVKKNVCN